MKFSTTLIGASPTGSSWVHIAASRAAAFAHRPVSQQCVVTNECMTIAAVSRLWAACHTRAHLLLCGQPLSEHCLQRRRRVLGGHNLEGCVRVP